MRTPQIDKCKGFPSPPLSHSLSLHPPECRNKGEFHMKSMRDSSQIACASALLDRSRLLFQLICALCALCSLKQSRAQSQIVHTNPYRLNSISMWVSILCQSGKYVSGECLMYPYVLNTVPDCVYMCVCVSTFNLNRQMECKTMEIYITYFNYLIYHCCQVICYMGIIYINIYIALSN